ncbi:hypothetical protein [Variovorax sp. EBFNA2]|uniref:hypothetical protein n=1 Tax=Variovorax sp. EBFNA2 TaxID=3342097 RepID=UPI0035A01C7E
MAIEPHLPGVGLVEARDEVEQRGLACAVRADHAQQFAFAHLQVDGIDGREPAETAHEAAHFKQWRGHRRCDRK